MKIYKILAINLGSTSTKVAYYENDSRIYNEDISHKLEDISQFTDIFDQYQYRYDELIKFLKNKGIQVEDLDCIVTRGGHTKPITGGIYKINNAMVEQSKSRKYGTHPCDLGLQIAQEIEKLGALALTVDPPVTDEFEPLRP